MPSFPDTEPALSGSGARLRAVAERDIPEILIAHQDDPGLHLALGLPRPPSGAQLGRRIEREAAQRADGVGAWLTITDADGAGADTCRGQVEVYDVDWDHRRAQLRIWVVPERRGEGRGRSALALAGRWLLMVCGLMRVELLIDPANEALTRAAAAAGFSAEGILRGYRRSARPVAGRSARADVLVLSLIATDLAAT